MWRRHKKTLQPSPQPSWHLTRWAKSASWHCARHLWWLAENIFTTWLWSRSHPALASFSPCTTKDWFILWFAACQRFTGPLSPRYSGMFDMLLLANSIPKYDNHGAIHLGYCNRIATLKQLYLNIFEHRSPHIYKFTTFFLLFTQILVYPVDFWPFHMSFSLLCARILPLPAWIQQHVGTLGGIKTWFLVKQR